MKWYKFEIYDNDSYLLEVSKVDRHKYITCNSCGLILKKRDLIEVHLPKYRVKRKKYHLSGSYDGFNVVSHSFKDLYDSLNWKGLVFYDIPKSKGFYLIECTEVVKVNETELPVQFENKCNECGQYMGIYGNVPPYLNSTTMDKMKSNTFYRSNLEFGNDFEHGYSLFASEKIATILKEEKLIIDKDLIEVFPVT